MARQEMVCHGLPYQEDAYQHRLYHHDGMLDTQLDTRRLPEALPDEAYANEMMRDSVIAARISPPDDRLTRNV